jgi:hypothetical protein
MVQQIYTEGKYLEENPAWHIEDSPWKAEHIRRIVTQNMLEPY